MSETEKSQKTEQPTTKRLRKAKEQGQVASSKDVVTIFLIIGVLIYFYVSWQTLWVRMQLIIIESTTSTNLPFNEAARELFVQLQHQFARIVFPLMALLVIVGVLSHVVQFGFVFSTEPLVPRFSKLNPINGFKKIFSLRNLIEFFKSLTKVTIMTIVGIMVFRVLANDLVRIPKCGLDCAILILKESVSRTMWYSVPFILVIAAFDSVIQRRLYRRDQRMTKEEVKRERKEDTGDPHVTGQRKSLHKEIVSDLVHQSVEGAVIVLFDYGDRAVVLQYVPDEMPLPVISLITRGAMTEKIGELSREYRKRVVRNGELVNNLITYGRQGQYIPSECVEDVANALRPSG